MIQFSMSALNPLGRVGLLFCAGFLLVNGSLFSAPLESVATPAKEKPAMSEPRVEHTPVVFTKPAMTVPGQPAAAAAIEKPVSTAVAPHPARQEKVAETEPRKAGQKALKAEENKAKEKAAKKVAKETSGIDASKYPSPWKWPWGSPFKVTTPDGIILRGMYQPPRPPRQTVVVFIDGGMNNFMISFRPLVARLAAKGYGIAVYDARGTGISMDKVGGGKYDLGPHSIEPEPYKKMVDDAKLVVKFLRDKKAIRPFRLILCGVSIGANVAIMAAAELPMDIRSVVAISAGTNYRGLRPLSAAQNLGGRSLFAICAADDSFAYTLIQQLRRTVPNSDTSIVSGKDSGHALLNPGVVEKIAEWLDAH